MGAWWAHRPSELGGVPDAAGGDPGGLGEVHAGGDSVRLAWADAEPLGMLGQSEHIRTAHASVRRRVQAMNRSNAPDSGTSPWSKA